MNWVVKMNNITEYLIISFLSVLTITFAVAYDTQKKITSEIEQELANVTWQRDQCRHLYKQGI